MFKSSNYLSGSTDFRPRFLHIVEFCSKVLQKILKNALSFILSCLVMSLARQAK